MEKVATNVLTVIAVSWGVSRTRRGWPLVRSSWPNHRSSQLCESPLQVLPLFSSKGLHGSNIGTELTTRVPTREHVA